MSENKPCAEQCPFRSWEEGFPVDRDQEHYVTRRELTRFLTLGSALMAGANCAMAWMGRMDANGPPAAYPVQRLGVAKDFKHGTAALFRYPTDADPCLLVRDSDGVLRAYSQVCTHLSCAIVYHAEEATLFCPCHRGYFALEDGRPTGGPPIRRLPRIRLEERGGQIYATGVDI